MGESSRGRGYVYDIHYFLQAEGGIRDGVSSRELGHVYKRRGLGFPGLAFPGLGVWPFLVWGSGLSWSGLSWSGGLAFPGLAFPGLVFPGLSV